MVSHQLGRLAVLVNEIKEGVPLWQEECADFNNGDFDWDEDEWQLTT